MQNNFNYLYYKNLCHRVTVNKVRTQYFQLDTESTFSTQKNKYLIVIAFAFCQLF